MSVVGQQRAVKIGIALAIFLIICGMISFIYGLEYDRSVSIHQDVEPMHVYSFSFHSSAAANVHISYNLSRGDMNLLITNPEGYDEILATGYPSESNILLFVTDTSNGSQVWKASSEGTYYLVFMMFSGNSDLHAVISYTGGVPELIQLGIISILLGTVIALMNLFLRGRQPRKGSVEESRSQGQGPTPP